MPPTARFHQALHACLKPLSRSIALAFAAAACATLPMPSRANPQGGVVVGGAASISQPSPALTTVLQQTPNAIINWQSFSIGSGEAVRFNQPSPTSAVLNRVVGNDPSSILGTLSANGRVYLVNQNGVFVGPGAQIDASSLVLSTANVSNDDFMAGRLIFNQPGKPDAKIVNEGRLTARDGGLVALVAPGVENRGVISARLGQVVLAGAPAFSLDLLGDGMVNVLLTPQSLQNISDAGGKPLSNYVDSSGQITADGGRIWIAAAQAKGIVDSMVHVGGELRATRVEQKGGEITLLGGDSLKVTGRVVATSADGVGGALLASADNIGLASTALLDASGRAGGGSVLVGGEFQGKTPVPGASSTARTLEVEAGARIVADASGARGQGGKVVLWSEDDTRFLGHVSARAGSAGGNGGLIEVSGKKHLLFDGTASTEAPNGQLGTLLLDPGSITVAASGGGDVVASNGDSQVAASRISQMLRDGSSNIELKADDNITVDAVIDGRPLKDSGGAWSGAGLTLTAGGNVAVNQYIVLAGGGFSATSERGSFTQGADTGIVSLAKDGSLAQGSISIQAAANVNTQYLLTQGEVKLGSLSGQVKAGQALGGVFGNATAPLKSLTVTAGAGGVDLSKGALSRGDVRVESAGKVQLGAVATDGGLSVAGASIVSTADQRAVQDVRLTASSGDIDIKSVESLRGGLSIDASAGSVTTAAGSTLLTHGALLSVHAGKNIDARGSLAANDPGKNASDAGRGKLSLTAGGDITVNELVATQSVDIVSSAGSVTLLRALGGPDEEHPAIGSMFISAGKNVSLQGLNLAGSPEKQTGLEVAAGSSGQGGQIFVNDRIGVSSGDIWFGPRGDARTSENYQIVLAQGVYARNGNSSITFNVPVVTSAAEILASWRSSLGVSDSLYFEKAPPDSVQNLAKAKNPDGTPVLKDMLLIPTSLGNTSAERLVVAGKGLRVVFDKDGKNLFAVCASEDKCANVPEGWVEYFMIPKIVISNQENSDAKNMGAVKLLGGVTTGESTGSSLKVIVPAGGDSKNGELKVGENNGKQYYAIEQCTTERCVVPSTAFFGDFTPNTQTINPNQLQNFKVLPWREIKVSPSRSNDEKQLQISDGLIATPRMENGGGAPVEITFFDGILGEGDKKSVSDNYSVLPSGGLGYSSSSNPANFPSNIGTGTNVSFAGLSAVLPDAPSGTNNGMRFDFKDDGSQSARQTAAVNAFASDRGQNSSTDCRTTIRVVAGRSRGDEADVGTASALRGAPLPALKTVYAMGDVAAGLTSADGDRIRGTSDSSSVDCL